MSGVSDPERAPEQPRGPKSACLLSLEPQVPRTGRVLSPATLAPPPFLSLRRSRAELGPLERCMVRAALRGPAPGRAAVFLKYARPQRQGTSLTAAYLLRHSLPGPP